MVLSTRNKSSKTFCRNLQTEDSTLRADGTAFAFFV